MILEKMGLQNWLEVFHQDLGILYDRRGKWESVQEFLLLNRHIERFLWQFGVFPWRNDQGEVRVKITVGTDVAQFMKTRENNFS
jgi:hypothetical protein